MKMTPKKKNPREIKGWAIINPYTKDIVHTHIYLSKDEAKEKIKNCPHCPYESSKVVSVLIKIID